MLTEIVLLTLKGKLSQICPQTYLIDQVIEFIWQTPTTTTVNKMDHYFLHRVEKKTSYNDFWNGLVRLESFRKKVSPCLSSHYDDVSLSLCISSSQVLCCRHLSKKICFIQLFSRLKVAECFTANEWQALKNLASRQQKMNFKRNNNISILAEKQI